MLMIQESGNISRKELKQALLRSGYLLEARVEAVIRERWGHVETNASYEDPDTKKSREYDISSLVAYKAGPDKYGYIFGFLVMECINNPQPLAVLTKEPLTAFLHHEDIKMSGLPVKVPDKTIRIGWRRLCDYLKMDQYHHYCKGNIGTQFCSFVRKKMGKTQEWMAVHDSSHFDSFQKLCSIVDYEKRRHFLSWTLGGKESVNLQIYYPVIVLQGELVEAQQTFRSVKLRRANHIQFRRSIASTATEQHYQIDIIRERYLPKYLDILELELEKTAMLLRRRHVTIRAAIDRIVSEASKYESKEDISKVMGYKE